MTLPEASRVHASAVAIEQRGLLITGTSGSGKSGLALELMALGAELVADDQTELFRNGTQVWARAPQKISGLIEARGLGILRTHAQTAPITAVVDLDCHENDRLPPKRWRDLLGVRTRLFHKVEQRSWPSALAVYLRFGLEESV